MRMGFWMIVGFPIVLLTSVGLAIIMFVSSVSSVSSVSNGEFGWLLLYGIVSLLGFVVGCCVIELQGRGGLWMIWRVVLWIIVVLGQPVFLGWLWLPHYLIWIREWRKRKGM